MRLLSAAWFPVLLAHSGAPASCPADGSPAPLCAAGSEPAPAPALGAAPGAASEREPGDAQRRALVDQEISHLRDLVRLCRERVQVLRELQTALAEGRGPPGLPEVHSRALLDGLPPVWEVAGDAETSEAAAAGDFVVSKATISQEEPVAMIRWLPLRSMRGSGNPSASQASMPSTLLVAAKADGTVRLFAPQGELALSFSAEHEAPVVQLTVSPLHDEYVVATGDAGGLVRVYRINVRHRRASREGRSRMGPGGEKLSQHLGVQANVTAQLSGELRVPGPRAGAGFTALVMVSQQGTKYFVAGDSEGGIAIFTRSGALHSELKTPGAAPVRSLGAHGGSLVFVAGGEWGFVDLERFEVRRMRCSKFEGRISAAIVDSQQSSRVLAADDRGAVWVFTVRDGRTCKIEHRFSTEVTRPPLELASIRGFTLVLDASTARRGRASTVALNMTHAGKKRADPERASSAVVWRRWGPPVRSWAVYKRYQQGDLVAYLSADGLEIEVVEILMHVDTQSGSGENFANFKLPAFAVAIVLVVGYQYIQQQGAFDPSLVEMS